MSTGNSALWGSLIPGAPPTTTGPAGGYSVAAILYAALRASQVLQRPMRGSSASEGTEALELLNNLINTLNTNRNNIFTVRIDQWPTEARKQSYTLGSGGDWNGPRPQKITQANFLLPTDPPIRRKLKLWDDGQWAAIKLQEVYTYPEGLYNDGNYPLSQIYFRPIPDAVYQIELFTWQQLDAAVDGTSELAFPPGYREALIYETARRLCVAYGRPINPEVKMFAREAMAGLQQMNAVAPRLKSDSELTAERGVLNWMTGMQE